MHTFGGEIGGANRHSNVVETSRIGAVIGIEHVAKETPVIGGILRLKSRVGMVWGTHILDACLQVVQGLRRRVS